MDHIVRGVLDFRKNVYPEHKDLFGALADSQNPDVLFFTCSDSRIDPNMVTGSNPGDLFICRNAGNVIPPHSNETGGMTASIEYAVAVLGVRHIIVCGHTDCGAIKGALDIPALKGLPHVKEWLGHCRSAMEIVRERHGIDGDTPLDPKYLNEAIEENVLQQVQHLRTHPVVAAKLATGKIEIHGWVYDIKSGNIRCCGRDSIEFKNFDDYYAETIARVAEA
ncbi:MULTISPECIES: carbonic anhydrase [Marinobacter]|jgi:carbonic anhydrase|uniref:Carbonic anhydrase n=1 Tax=Marinobacter vinifirmus TaxID=355591 RepID=A0A259W5Q6_9GAMM|nr:MULTISPECIES: carbonic anhydrase [Marinobacter]KRW81959.1 carbonic anhydrase [Marinobacter sp. P4B1]MCE0761093.1 carbonic anhydrase [Marinobacter sp. G11]OZC37894.1 carbonic anhydrase [Marinobacter vinifirmus]TVT35485.1 MAG: carbonic anhydrase [Marinobacter vinifirmus]|tara:strand:+ start:308 stop:973 length:666 start_codon:yes stop_codon:yes gene_type:complete